MAARKKVKRQTAKGASTKFDVVDVGHKIWLAGLGALARAQNEGPKLFESLVEEGSAVQERTLETTERAFKSAIADVRGAAEERMSDLRGRANETWDNVEKIFQSRVQKALQQLGMPTSQEIRSLTRKVDELTRSVGSLGTTKSKRAGGRNSRGARSGQSSSHAGQGAAA